MKDRAILDAFFEECEDLLVALTEGLSDMREGQADDETVNAVFRAVHSIKGAAGAFSLDDLVGFAHTFETVLDEVRAGRLATDDAFLRVLQRAGDILADLVDAARDEQPANREQVDPVLNDLQGFLGEEGPEEEFVFEALGLDFDTPAVADKHLVSFQPSAAFYAAGNNPALLVAALVDLGVTKVVAEIGDLPNSFDSYDWEEGNLRWIVTVEGLPNDLQILEVFQFVDDLCDLKVEVEEPEVPPAPIAVEEATPMTVEDLAERPQAVVSEAKAIEELTKTEPQQSKTDAPADRPAKRAAATLRVDPDRVDRLINAVGELIINQSVISQRLQEADLPNSGDLFSDLDDYK